MTRNELPEPTSTDTKGTRAQLDTWIGWVNDMIAADTEKRNSAFLAQAHPAIDRHIRPTNPKTVYVDTGRKYIRIGISDGGTFCFVRAADGAILKSANRKSPALNKIRGWIWDEDVAKSCTIYGARYQPGVCKSSLAEEAPQGRPSPGGC